MKSSRKIDMFGAHVMSVLCVYVGPDIFLKLKPPFGRDSLNESSREHESIKPNAVAQSCCVYLASQTFFRSGHFALSSLGGAESVAAEGK